MKKGQVSKLGNKQGNQTCHITAQAFGVGNIKKFFRDSFNLRIEFLLFILRKTLYPLKCYYDTLLHYSS